VRSTPQRDKDRLRTPADTAGERGEDHAMMQIGIAPAATQIRSARSAVRAHLDDERYAPDQIRAVEAVVSELLGAAFDSGVHEPIQLSVESFALLTSVRVHCSRNVQLRDEPFGLRERVLGGFAFAWGKRQRGDGSVDLWAELARPGH
jgi:hypothetical protein